MTRASFHHTLSHAYPPGRVRNGRAHDLGLLPEASGRLFPEPRRSRQARQRGRFFLSYCRSLPSLGEPQIIGTVVSPLHRCASLGVQPRVQT